jgi:hypothetical protein
MTGVHPWLESGCPPSLALPSSRFDSGTFYFAEKRNFLFCVDRL